MSDKEKKTVTLPLGDTIPGPVTIQAKKNDSSKQNTIPIIDESVNDGIGAGTARDVPSSSNLKINDE